MWQAMQNDPKMYVSSEEGLEKYLHYLKQLGVAKNVRHRRGKCL